MPEEAQILREIRRQNAKRESKDSQDSEFPIRNNLNLFSLSTNQNPGQEMG